MPASALLKAPIRSITRSLLLLVASVAFVMLAGDKASGLAACTINWDGGAGTNAWATAANWDLDRVPAGADHVCIPDVTPNVSVTVTNNVAAVAASIRAHEQVVAASGSLTVSSIEPSEFRAGLTISGATVTLSTPATVSALTHSGGTLGGSGAVVVTESFTWSSGTTNGPGSTTIASGATGSFTFNSNAFLFAGRTLTNQGTVTWSGGPLYTGQGAGSTLVNSGTLTLTATNAGFESVFCCGGATFRNTGTLTRTALTGRSSFSSSFENDGAVFANGGTLAFPGGGTGSSDGAFVIAAGAVLELGGSAMHTLTSASSIDGPGTFVANGSVSVSGAYDAGATTISGSNVSFSGPAPSFGLLTVSGTATFNTPFSVARLTQTSGTIKGSASIIITEAWTWSGGEQNGSASTTIAAGATASFSFSGNAYLQNGRTLVNDGSITWTGGPMYTGQTAATTFVNNGTITITSSNAGFERVFCCAGATFRNNGALRRIAGTGRASFGVALDNDGTIEVITGTFAFGGGGSGTSTGSFTVAEDATLEFGGATHTLSGSIAGDGTLRSVGTLTSTAAIDVGSTEIVGSPSSTFGGPSPSFGALTVSGNATFDTAFSIGRLTQTSGTIKGTGAITVTETLSWAGGEQSGATSTTVTPEATAAFTFNSSAYLQNGRTFINDGTIAWSGGTMYTGQTSASTFINNGTITMTGSISGFEAVFCCAGGTLRNNGTIERTAGTGRVGFSVLLDNDGVIDVDTGTVAFTGGGSGTSSGAFTVAENATLQIGGNAVHALTGPITGAGDLHSTGNVTFSGLIDVATAKVTGATSTFNGPSPSFGALTIAGNANFHESFTVPRLTQTSGTLGGPATITVADNLTWVAGEQTGPGATTIAPDATGSFVINSSAYLQNGRTLVNRGTVTWSGGQIYTGNGLRATFRNEGTLTFTGNGGYEAVFCCAGGSIENVGTLIKDGGTGTSRFTVISNPSGTIRALTGRIETLGLSQYSGATKTLGGGTYEIEATFVIHNADVLQNSSTLILDGPGARLLDQSGNDALRNLAANDATGALELRNGANLNLARAVTNAGTVVVGEDSTLLTQGYTQTDGVTTLQERTSRLGASAGTVDIEAGVLRGIGSVGSRLTGTGIVSPGLSPGRLSVTGDWDATGTLDVELGATHDQLRVDGTAALGGTLALTTMDGFEPAAGDRFRIVQADATSGSFADVTGTDIGNGFFYDVQVEEDGVVAVVRRPGLAVSDVTVDEGGNATFTVSVAPAPRLPVSVAYATADGSATEPEDYAGATGVLTFAPGETSQTVTVEVATDDVDEPNETFTLQLSDPLNTSISDGTGEATIVDVDPDCTVLGTDGDDVLHGTAGADVICGLGGNDVIVGLAGDDVLVGGDGNDQITAGPGADVVIAGSGDDRIVAIDAQANDSLNGGAGTDECLADEGDVVTGCP